jgi:membrane carboxypeptidase/penicillin-binding protein
MRSRRFQSQGGYALDMVRRDLDLILEQQEIEDGGLQVFTTLNKDLQDAPPKQSVEKRLAAVEKLKSYQHPKKADFDKTWDGTQEITSTPYLQGLAHDAGQRDRRHPGRRRRA